MVKYELPDKNDLTQSLTGKFDKFVTSGDWKVLNEDNKLQQPKSKLDFVKQFDDKDCILNHIYINAKRTLFEEIQNESKKNYRASFIFLNMNPEIKGTMFEDESIVKLGKLFDEYYGYLSDKFSTEILDMYNKSEIIEVFEKESKQATKAESSK